MKHALQPAHIVIAAGVCAALHVGKLAPALHTLQQALGLTLVQAGFLLSAVQGAGMLLGLAFGAVADGLGARRSMASGLLLLAAASAAGAAAQGVGALMVLRVLEGFGFLLAVLPAPGRLRQLVPPARVNTLLGYWGAYMPLATALALLLGPWCLQAFGWRAWWALLAGLSLLMAGVLWRGLPASAASPGPQQATAWWGRLGAPLSATLNARGPWLAALTFAMYSGQWLAVVGFLPAICLAAGVSGATTALLTAAVAAANMAGNIASGRLLQRGVRPAVLLATGFGAMTLAAFAAFGQTAAGNGLPPPARFAAALLFSGVGGLIPGTLFSLALRVAPGPGALSTTVGWVQQWSALGQFAGPPLVAWVASLAGGWQFTWVATGLCSLAGVLFAAALVRGLPAAAQDPVAASR